MLYLDSRFRLMSVKVQSKPFSVGAPSAVVQLGGPGVGVGRSFDVTADGQRIVTIKRTEDKSEAQPNQLRVVLNWDEELKRLAPAKK